MYIVFIRPTHIVKLQIIEGTNTVVRCLNTIVFYPSFTPKVIPFHCPYRDSHPSRLLSYHFRRFSITCHTSLALEFFYSFYIFFTFVIFYLLHTFSCRFVVINGNIESFKKLNFHGNRLIRALNS